MTQSPSAKAPPRPFLAAAPEPQALAARLRDLAARPGASPFEALTPPDWARLGFAAQTEADRIALLEAAARLLERRPDLGVFHKHGVAYRRRAVEECKVAALFSDEEAVHPGMGRALASAFPLAARAARGFDAIFEALGHPTLTRTLWGADPRLDARLRLPIYAQLGAAALAAGQFALLRAGGFAPDMVAGYGSGELTALWAAEAIDDEALGALLYARGGAMSAPDPRRPSGNLRVLAPVERSLDLIEESGLRVFVARLEAPARHVLGGDAEALEAFSARLLGRGIEHRLLPGGVSWHSGRAEVAAAAFAGALRRARVEAPRIPFHDGESAEGAAPEAIAALLERRLLKPLRFQEAIERMHAEGVRIFVEFGPGDGLSQCVREILGEREHMAVALDDGDPERSALRAMEAAAALAAAGARFKGERPPLPAPAPAPAPTPAPAAPKRRAEPEEEPPPATTLLAAAMAEEAVLAAALPRPQPPAEAPAPRFAETAEDEAARNPAAAQTQPEAEPIRPQTQAEAAPQPQILAAQEAQAPEPQAEPARPASPEAAPEPEALAAEATRPETPEPQAEPEQAGLPEAAAPEAEAEAAPAQAEAPAEAEPEVEPEPEAEPEAPSEAQILPEAQALAPAEPPASAEASSQAASQPEAPAEPEKPAAPAPRIFDSAPEAPVPVGFAEALSEAAPDLPPPPAPPPAPPAEREAVAETPAAPPAPILAPAPAPLTGAALALRLAEQITAAHERFLEGQAEALRALLEAAADPEAVFAIEEARRDSAEAHRLYLEAVAALGGSRPRATTAPPAPPPALAALAAQEADWPPAPEAAEEASYSDPPQGRRSAPEPKAEAVEEAIVIFDAPAAAQAQSGAAEAQAVEKALEREAAVEEALEAEAAVEEALEAEAAVEEALEAEAAVEEALEAEAAVEEALEAEAAVEEALEAEAAVEEALEAEAAVEEALEAEAAVEEALEAEAAVAVVAAAEAVVVVNLPAVVPRRAFEVVALPDSAKAAAEKAPDASHAPEASDEAQPFARLTRRAFRLAPLSAPALRPLNPGDSRWLVVGDPPLAAALVASLQAKTAGEVFAAVAAPADAGAFAIFQDGGLWTGLIYLHAEGEEESVALGRLELARSLVEAAQENFHEAAARGERRLFAAVARLDGRMGYGGATSGLGAAGFGLAKALAAAEPNLFCRAVDLAPALPLEQAAEALAEELLDADRGRVEAAVDAQGRRFEVRAVEETVAAAPAAAKEPDEIFVLIGDARGVATLWLEETAARARRRFLILGEHRLLTDEPEWAVGLQSEETLRWAAFQALEAEGADEDRAAVGAVALSEAVIADRETRACLAELRRLGSEAAYATIDFAAPEAADQIAGHMAEAGEGPVSVFYAPPTDPQTSFSEALARRMRRVETLLDGFSGADLRRLWFLPPPLDETESLSETMADETVRRFAMGAGVLGIDVRSLLWAVAEEIEPGLVGALAAELRRPASELGMAMIGGAETPLSLRRVEAEALAAGGAALKAAWSPAAEDERRRPLSPPLALTAAFAAVERFAPGWRAEGCDGATLAHGLNAGEAAPDWIAVSLSALDWPDPSTLRADLEILDAAGKTRLRVEGARFSQRPPLRAEDQAADWPKLQEPQDSAEDFYVEGLQAGLAAPQGPQARLLTAFAMPEGAAEGVFAAALPGDLKGERSTLLDPALVEAMIQTALAAALRRSGRRGLPLRLEAFSVWGPQAMAQSRVLIEVGLKRETEKAAIWRLLARSPEGAPLLGFEAAVILEAAAGAQPVSPAPAAFPAQSA